MYLLCHNYFYCILYTNGNYYREITLVEVTGLEAEQSKKANALRDREEDNNLPMHKAGKRKTVSKKQYGFRIFRLPNR